MSRPSSASLSNPSLVLLSRLLLAPPTASSSSSLSIDSQLTALSRNAVDDLAALASSNHVIVRGLQNFLAALKDPDAIQQGIWVTEALAAERSRVTNAIAFLHAICNAFAERGYDVTVIKSLDHWPDLGSDLDLYTNTDAEAVCALMQSRFQAKIAPRSWGDRLARKWNFVMPGLPEAVEIHMGRLGQTGEQITLAASVPRRSRQVQIDGRTFTVASVSDRLLISTLQRMYRHFYFRLCDIVDSAGLVETGAIDYDDLQRAASAAGIWEGTATYLAIVSDYVELYRGTGLNLPPPVREAARFGGEHIFFAREFLRVPILPQSAGLYGSQLGGMLRRCELQSSARLGLLPWLATAAVVGQKLTGSDKGIW